MVQVAQSEQLYQPIIKSLQNSFGERLKTVILFGSQARREARPESDHDLLVVIEGLPIEPVSRQKMVRLTLLPVLEELPGPVNFVAKTPAEVDANLTPLLLEVCVDGICLFGEKFFTPYRQKALTALNQSGLQRRQLYHTRMWLFPHLPVNDWSLTWEGYRERA